LILLSAAALTAVVLKTAALLNAVIDDAVLTLSDASRLLIAALDALALITALTALALLEAVVHLGAAQLSRIRTPTGIYFCHADQEAVLSWAGAVGALNTVVQSIVGSLSL